MKNNVLAGVKYDKVLAAAVTSVGFQVNPGQ